VRGQCEIIFFHDGSVEDEGNNYGVSNFIGFIGMMTYTFFFSNDDIKMETVSPPWNNENKFQVSLPRSSVGERRRMRQERICFST
jgi:hypothetical protein